MATLGDMINAAMTAAGVEVSTNKEVMAFLQTEEAKTEVTPETALPTFERFFVPKAKALDDPDLKTLFWNNHKGSIHGSIMEKEERGYLAFAKEHGLDQDHMRDLFKQYPDVKERAIAIGKYVREGLEAKYKDKLSGQDATAAEWEEKVKKIQNDLNAQNAEIRGQIDHWKGQYEKATSEYERKLKKKDVVQYIQSKVKFNPNMPKDAIHLKVEAVSDTLLDSYNVTHSKEKQGFELLDPETNNVAFGPNNQRLEFDKVLTQYFDESWIDTGKGNGTTGDGKTVTSTVTGGNFTAPNARTARAARYLENG